MEYLTKLIERFLRNRKQWKRWQKIVSLCACIVVFITTYALILPAITIEKNACCGYEEHPAHTVEAGCYKEVKTLVCTKPENPGHVHGDSCYETETVLTCGLEKSDAVDEEGNFIGHHHTEACYGTRQVLVCGQQEMTPHTHNASCYKIDYVLTCKKPIHSHSVKCYPSKSEEKKAAVAGNASADVVTRGDWEASLGNVKRTGKWNDDVIAIAESQLGYQESSRNYIVEGGRKKGYSKFGDWYGDKYGDWCAMFVSFCLNYAEIDRELMPLDANCQSWINKLKTGEKLTYLKNDEYIPKKGDLIFFDWDGYEKEEYRTSDHIGMVVELIYDDDAQAVLDEREDDQSDGIEITADNANNVIRPVKVKTIEGNSSNMVRYVVHKFEDDHIMGYGVLPDNPEYKEDQEPETSVEKETGEEIDEEIGEELEEEEITDDENAEDEILEDELSEDEELDDAEETEDLGNLEYDETLEGMELEDTSNPFVQSFEGEDYVVTVTYTEEAEIPEEAVLQVSEIDQTSSEYKEYCDQAAEILQVENLLQESEGEGREIETIQLDENTVASGRADSKDDAEAEGIETIEAMVFARFFDIRFESGSQIIEPKAPVDVTITYTEPVEMNEDDKASVVHFAEDGTEIIDVETNLDMQDADKQSDQNIQNNDATAANSFTFTQGSFSITGTVVTGIQIPYGEVIMYVESGGKYYALAYDGSAVEVSVNNGTVTCVDNARTDIIWNYEGWDSNQMTISNSNGPDKVYLQPTRNGLTSTTASGVKYTTFNNGAAKLYATTRGWITSTDYYLRYNNGFTTSNSQSNGSTIHFATSIARPAGETGYYKVVSQIEPGKEYLIVSAEGNYALTYNTSSTVKASSLKLNPVKGNPGVFEIAGVDDTMKWNLQNASNGRMYIQSVSSNRYLRNNNGLTLGTANDQNRSFQFTYKSQNNDWNPAGTWTIKNYNSGTYLNVDTNAFSLKASSYTNDMLILEKVDRPSIPSDPTGGSSGSGEGHQMDKPTYDGYINTSDKKDVDISEGDVIGHAYSDKATSQLEDLFKGQLSDDGKILEDKSVIYGGDDYEAFGEYGKDTFGVTLSALAQEYSLENQQMIPTPIDVVFVLDVSGSMGDQVNANDTTTRREAMVNAVNASMQQIYAQNENNRAGVVVFGSGSWDLLDIDRYTPVNNEYLTVSGEYVYSVNGLRDSKGNAVDQRRDSHQKLGTYTQSGIARGAAMFERVQDTVYHATVGTGTTERNVDINRQPVIILLSDGAPTHCTSNYQNVLNGPNYGNGLDQAPLQNHNPNSQGVQGYYTILSANYYKSMVGIHYDVPAKFYTIGMGIYETGFYASPTTSLSGDHYKRAVLNPTAANINDLSMATSGLNDNARTAIQLQNLLNNQVSDPYISLDTDWDSASWGSVGELNQNVPVLKNPYSNYSYADGAYFGHMTQAQLEEIFSNIIAQSLSVKKYGFILVQRSAVEIEDPIGDGMELKSVPILRYGGENYEPTDSTSDGNVTRYIYEYRYTASDGSNFKADLSQIEVTVTTDAQGRQTVKMSVPDDILPVYAPCEVVGNDWYYESLPVRLIYQVGLTEESKQAVASISPGTELSFYTNRYDPEDPEQGAKAIARPQAQNPYYKPDGPYQNTTTGKEDNTTGTASYSSDYVSGTEHYQEDPEETKIIYNHLGNNGKLYYTKESTSVPIMIEKTDMSGELITSDPAEFKIYEDEGLTRLIGTYSTDQGTVTINDLIIGQTYYLKESKAPEGYSAVQDAEQFVLTKDSETDEVQITGITPGHPYISVKDGDVLTIQVKNSNGYTLPESGGMGTTLFTLGGLLLMGISLLYGFILRRKQERRIN